MQKQLISLTIVLTLLTGCAGMTDRQQTIFQGSALGMASGAAAGALIGQAVSGDTTGTLVGAGIGAAIGAFAGGAYGTHVADKKNDYATTEEYLNACLVAAKDASNQAKEYNAKVCQQITEDEKEIGELVAKYNRKQVDSSQLQKRKKETEKQIAEMQTNHEAIQHQIKKQKEALAQGQGSSSSTVAQLDTEIKKLEEEARKLEEETNTLASINQRIKI